MRAVQAATEALRTAVVGARDKAILRVRDVAEAREPPADLASRALLLPFLRAASVVYGAGVWARGLPHALGLAEVARAPAPVISVGNVTWGGSGKTPMAEYVARRWVAQAGAGAASAAILCRGYAGGDEARMLARRLAPGPIQVWAGRDRVKLAAEALQSCPGASVVVLDDGLQYRRLHRDLDIVMVNALVGLGSGFVIPRGPLREPPESALRRAHLVVLHHAALLPEHSKRAMVASLKALIPPNIPLLASQMTPARLMPVGEGGKPAGEPVEAIRGAAVLCVSGVGCPLSFQRLIAELGAAHVASCTFKDHHAFTARDLQGVEAAYHAMAREHTTHRAMLVLTEKDYERDPELICEQLQHLRPLVLKCSLSLTHPEDEHVLDALLADLFAQYLANRVH